MKSCHINQTGDGLNSPRYHLISCDYLYHHCQLAQTVAISSCCASSVFTSMCTRHVYQACVPGMCTRHVYQACVPGMCTSVSEQNLYFAAFSQFLSLKIFFCSLFRLLCLIRINFSALYFYYSKALDECLRVI